MKTKLFSFAALLTFIFSCNPPANNNNNSTDTSPGVDEYVKFDLNAYHFEENDDEVILAILANTGSNFVYSLSTTSHADSNHFVFTLPYFHANDTTWNLTSPLPTDVNFQFHTDSVYTGVTAGSIHIVRSNVNSMEVFTGTFNYTGTAFVTNSPAAFTNGEFVIARL